MILHMKYIPQYEMCENLGVTVLERYSTYVGLLCSDLPSFSRVEDIGQVEMMGLFS